MYLCKLCDRLFVYFMYFCIYVTRSCKKVWGGKVKTNDSPTYQVIQRWMIQIIILVLSTTTSPKYYYHAVLLLLLVLLLILLRILLVLLVQLLLLVLLLILLLLILLLLLLLLSYVFTFSRLYIPQ